MSDLSAPLRLCGYAAILAVVTLGAYGIGTAVGPIGIDAPATSEAPNGSGAPEH